MLRSFCIYISPPICIDAYLTKNPLDLPRTILLSIQILDQQKKEKTESQPLITVDGGNDTAIEMGLTSRRKGTHSKSTNKRIPVV